MITKAIFIIALSLTSLLGMTSVQSEVEQSPISCTTHESITISPTGGGFTDLIITRIGLVLLTKEVCGIVEVDLSTSNDGCVYNEKTSEPQSQFFIPLSAIAVAGNYSLVVIGDSGCYDYHQISVQ